MDPKEGGIVGLANGGQAGERSSRTNVKNGISKVS